MIKSFQHFTPEIHSSAWIAENATIIGEVVIAAECSIWYNAVLRGDVGAISIGEGSNIQDGAMVHCTKNRSKTIIGERVVVGHHAILHGCQIENEVLIGMGAIILDEVVIPSQTIIAAGALVPENKKLISGYVYAGVPAKQLREIRPEELTHISVVAERYKELALEHSRT